MTKTTSLERFGFTPLSASRIRLDPAHRWFCARMAYGPVVAFRSLEAREDWAQGIRGLIRFRFRLKPRGHH